MVFLLIDTIYHLLYDVEHGSIDAILRVSASIHSFHDAVLQGSHHRSFFCNTNNDGHAYCHDNAHLYPNFNANSNTNALARNEIRVR